MKEGRTLTWDEMIVRVTEINGADGIWTAHEIRKAYPAMPYKEKFLMADAVIRLEKERDDYRDVLKRIIECFYAEGAEDKACIACDANLHPTLEGKHGQVGGGPCPIEQGRAVLAKWEQR